MAMKATDALKGLDWKAIAALVALSLLLAVANNFRVYEEQRIVLFPEEGESA